MLISTFLERSRDYLAVRKLCKGDLGRLANGCGCDPSRKPPKSVVACCIFGAMAGARHSVTNIGDTELTAVDFMQDIVGINILAFNDNPKTRKRDVIRAFNRAIKLAKANGQ